MFLDISLLEFLLFFIIPFFFAFKTNSIGTYIIQSFYASNAELFLKFNQWRNRKKKNNIIFGSFTKSKWFPVRKKLIRNRFIRDLFLAIVFSSFSLFISSQIDNAFLPFYTAFIVMVFLFILMSEIDRRYCLIPDVISFPSIILTFLIIGLKEHYIDVAKIDNAVLEGVFSSLSVSVINSALSAFYAYALCTFATIIMSKKYPNGFGGGDIKLLTFIAALCGFVLFPKIVILSFIYFAIVSICYRDKYMPYAPFALAGFATILIWNVFSHI